LVGSLREAIDTALRPLVEGRRCALVGFPSHANPGDSAIWVGERAALARAGAEVVYTCDEAIYEPRQLEKRLGDGVLLIQGGGDFGDLWPDTQRFRERVLADFAGYAVVQLPQSLEFRRADSLERAAAALSAHGNVSLLVRDRRSLGVAEQLGATALLCPDMALALGPLERAEQPVTDVLWLSRTDAESGADRKPGAEDVEIADWAYELPAAVGRVKARLGPRLRRSARLRRLAAVSSSRSFDAVARHRVAYAIGLLSRGRALVTDRLHGHILALLLGVPHVLLAERHGKNRAFYETWTKDTDLVLWCDEPAGAVEAARGLLARQA